MSRIYEKLSTTNLPTTTQQHLPATIDDGWDDAAAEMASKVLRGTLLKFADWKWIKGAEATEVEEGTQLVALGTTAAWVKWQGGKPVQYEMRQPGQNCPTAKRLVIKTKRFGSLGRTTNHAIHGRARGLYTCSIRLAWRCLPSAPPRLEGAQPSSISPIRSHACASLATLTPRPSSNLALHPCRRSLDASPNRCSKSSNGMAAAANLKRSHRHRCREKPATKSHFDPILRAVDTKAARLSF